jgi:protein-S-isoprenylcysteine O-methyltransferase Ste14
MLYVPISPSWCFTLFGISELALAIFKRSRGTAKDQDRGSLLLLWGVIGLSIFLAIFLTYAAPRFACTPNALQYYCGLVLFLLGIVLRWWAIVHLGRFFTVNVAIATDHRVVSDGPYRLVRHPSYAGIFLLFIGMGLLLFNWLSALVLVVPTFLLFLYRMRVEERALLQALGEPYRAYMARTKRLVPFLY